MCPSPHFTSLPAARCLRDFMTVGVSVHIFTPKRAVRWGLPEPSDCWTIYYPADIVIVRDITNHYVQQEADKVRADGRTQIIFIECDSFTSFPVASEIRKPRNDTAPYNTAGQ
jgi:hypothetical protein